MMIAVYIWGGVESGICEAKSFGSSFFKVMNCIEPAC